MRFRVMLLGMIVSGCGVQPHDSRREESSSQASRSNTAGSPAGDAADQVEPPSKPSIVLVNAGSGATFELHGLSSQELAALGGGRSMDQWPDVFSVQVAGEGSMPIQDPPPVLGTYNVDAELVRFTPDYPLVPGLTYRAVYQSIGADPSASPRSVEQFFSIPKPNDQPTTVLSNVFPSVDTLPENQLKFYLHFSAPMSRGEAYHRVHLLDAEGDELELPFLELDEELWDRQGVRFTLFLDPGRIKRGLRPREEVGPVFEQGKTYTLVVDRDWRDAAGNPLVDGFRKTIRVGAADDKQPDPNDWTVAAPKAGTTEPVTIRFPEPLDHAMLHRVIVVHDSEDRWVDGQVRVDENEMRWTLVPVQPWQAGDYTIQVQTDLEDLAGNSIARAFDVDVLEPISRSIKAERWSVPFRVAP